MKGNHQRDGWIPDRLMPVFWISEEYDDEYLPSNSLDVE